MDWLLARQSRIEEGYFTYGRRVEAIDREAQLYGPYVIRTSEPKQRLSAADSVRSYKNLAQVERAFHTLNRLRLTRSGNFGLIFRAVAPRRTPFTPRGMAPRTGLRSSLRRRDRRDKLPIQGARGRGPLRQRSRPPDRHLLHRTLRRR